MIFIFMWAKNYAKQDIKFNFPYLQGIPYICTTEYHLGLKIGRFLISRNF